MSRPSHFFHHHIKSKKKLSAFDKSAIVASFLYPMSGIPQMIDVVNGNVEGVSLLSWVGFLVFSTWFFIYGVVHRITPMIITDFLWIIVDSTIVISLLVHQIGW